MGTGLSCAWSTGASLTGAGTGSAGARAMLSPGTAPHTHGFITSWTQVSPKGSRIPGSW